MKAMILGAGKGTRVRPITQSIPKPMISIFGKPIMESIVDHFKNHGIDEIVVNTSHLAPVIENYFRSGHQFGVQISYSYEGKYENGSLVSDPLGSAGGMKKIQEHSGFFNETFVVVCGDAIVDVDLDVVLAFHRARNSIATIVTMPVAEEEVEKYGVVQTDDQGQVLNFQEKPNREEAISNTINTGIYIFEPDIFQYIPKSTEYDIGSELFPDLIAKNIPFYACAQDFQWIDVGSTKDIWTTAEMMMLGKVNNYVVPGKKVGKDVFLGINTAVNLEKITLVGPVFIGNGTKIEDGAEIYGPAIIGSNCVIERGAIISNCMLDNYTKVASLANLQDKVILGEHSIDREGEVLNLKEMDMTWLVGDARADMDVPQEFRELEDDIEKRYALPTTEEKQDYRNAS